MLFNTYIFLLVFLPTAWVCVEIAKKFSDIAWLATLLVSSLVFYAWWYPPMLGLLIGSIVFNYAAAQWISKYPSKAWFVLAIIANIVPLAIFKYLGFAGEILASLLDKPLSIPDLALPLAISFFTFQQIAYLVHVYRHRDAEQNVVVYATYVSFFPQLIAGPIVNPQELLPQLRSLASTPTARRIELGLTIFACGLGKKVLLADNLAPISDEAFGSAATGALEFTFAWLGLVAYSLQIYFDFSGYSDMAVGLACLFGVYLPINFASPYRAISLIEFWRTWHVTLSRFLKDHVYIPLGGNRKGTNRKLLFLAATMLLGGIWHGAGWTFIFWGLAHGVGLIVNHLFRMRFTPPAKWLSTGITLFFVTFCWVLFRSPDMNVAATFYTALLNPGFTAHELTAAELTVVIIGVAIALFGKNLYVQTQYDRAPNADDLPLNIAQGKTPTWFLAFAGLVMAASLPLLEELNAFIYFEF